MSAMLQVIQHVASHRNVRRSYILASAFHHHIHVKLVMANLACGLLPDFASGLIRPILYRMIGFDIGEKVAIMGNIEMVSGAEGFYANLHIARNTIVGNHVSFNLDEEVVLGQNVSISPYVKIYTGSHQIGPGSNRRMPAVVASPVTVEDGCWIGLGAMLLPGVTVGHGSVVGAGAVVSQDVPPNTFVQGNPAQVTRSLPWGDR